MIVGLLLQNAILHKRWRVSEVHTYSFVWCTTLVYAWIFPDAVQCTYVRYIHRTRMERNKKRKSEEEMEKGRRVDRDASEVLRRNSVIIRGGRDRPGKIIFRWEGNQFHDRIGESSIRTEAGARKCNGKWIKFQRMFLFRVSRLGRTLLHPPTLAFLELLLEINR